MDTVLVTGGTGHLGRDIVSRLKGSYRVRVLARSAKADQDVERIHGDLATGEGIAEALAGSQIVIHAATLSPAARRGYFAPKDLWSSPSEVDRDGTARLLELAGAAGVGHILYVSIVGIDRPRLPYLRRKLEAEYLIRQGPIPGRSPERPSSTGCSTACWARWLGCRSCRCPTCRWSRWIRPTSLTTSSSPSVTDRQAGWLISAAQPSSPSPRRSTSGARSGTVPYARCGSPAVGCHECCRRDVAQ